MADKKKKTDKKQEGIGDVFKKLIPGQLAKSINEKVNTKLKAATEKAPKK